MKVLVTGGAGYIGSHCTYLLIENGYDVVILDDLSRGNVQALHPQAKFYQGDMRDSAFLDTVFSENKIEAIMHFAAKIVVPESFEQPIEYFNNNVSGVEALLVAAKKYNIDKFVFSSTAAVYGTPQSVPCTETDMPNPESPYGTSKLAAEYLVRSCEEAYGIRSVIFRYFNVAGSDMQGRIGLAAKEITHLIPSVIEAVEGIRDQVTIFGTDYPTPDGTCVRDYIHVEDLVSAHLKGLEYLAKGNKSTIINLGDEKGYSVKEIVKAVGDTLNKTVPVQEGPRRGGGDPAIIVASNKRAKELLGWTPQRTLDDIITSDCNWRIKHPKGY